MPSVDQGAVDMGLKYVNNDICYPSILVTGQIMEAVLSGKYDLSQARPCSSPRRAAAAAPPTTSPCIRKALKDAGHPEVPVISLAAASGLDEDNPGFKIKPKMLLAKALYALSLRRPHHAAALPRAPLRGRARALPTPSTTAWMAEAKERSAERFMRRSFYEAVPAASVDAFEALPLVNDRLQAARGRGRRDPGQVPPHGQQPGGPRHRAGGLRGQRCPAWLTSSCLA